MSSCEQLGAGSSLEGTVKKVCSEYLMGLAWVFAYYSCGNNPVATCSYSLVFDEDTTECMKKTKGKEESKGPQYATWDW